jgi:serine/threonine protein phosphatase 1
MKSYVIGDIHGCANELQHLIDALPLAGGDRVVFLGDYIDRGPDSQGVISYLLELRFHRSDVEFVFLKGNHEDMLLSFLGISGAHGDMFLLNGGTATLESYGIEETKPEAEVVLSKIPSDHLEFYQRLQSFFLMSPILCVHAGIDPAKTWVNQTDDELLWIRNKFIYASHPLPYTILFGHTPQPTVFYDLPYKIGLDTGLVYGNMLTCLDVDEKVTYQISRGKKRVTRSSVQRKWKEVRAQS